MNRFQENISIPGKGYLINSVFWMGPKSYQFDIYRRISEGDKMAEAWGKVIPQNKCVVIHTAVIT